MVFNNLRFWCPNAVYVWKEGCNGEKKYLFSKLSANSYGRGQSLFQVKNVCKLKT